MKIGICLPYMKPDINRKTILDWCRAIDQGPFHSLSCGERISGYTYEMRVLLSAAAAVTERVRIVPSLYVLPMTDAVRAAKEIATLDVLSEGRVTVCVGVGGREDDYKAVGANFNNRFKRMDDQIATMKKIWAGEPAFEGGDEIGPRPIQAGGPPILVGAMGPKSISRISHWADGIYGFAMNGEQSLSQYFFDAADAAWQQSNRSTSPYKMGGFWYSLADNAESQLKSYVFDYLKIMGEEAAQNTANSMTRFTPEAIIDALDATEAAGAEEVFLVPATADIAEVDKLATLIARR
ncbi:LLM class flavin-dependent oxidoreductase [Oceanicoccus sp. KOV_DT_Chl]|uniref:LLM class flavin-dependent oxidoreductase n=1 Tax=Oceanicoccus sp. KOV_DT_Chl TaxID=1904639 RepID=UPI000C7D92C3|nr:LLM class flavin-dependent oxidoreductase [Oceanicoccus sp. KOV_DT_Chl]